ncbi:Mediator complex subunit Med20 [Macrophomina phaseolina MS6]|uniref:Mediator of RNA polymerase II transcription subunit 20 n=1 Tax=Macrophomina phaseolina (strain MS6) TaxID=1126212 RepID=K2R9H0_MACPH|nr:Mediator complex subunit Med20 [Macrophomina phaseolina MS6]
MPTSTTDKSPPHFQHVLGLGHYPDRAFVHIAGPDQQQDTQPDRPTTSITIPWQQMEQYSQLLNLKFGALWMYRMGLQITGGASYSLGEFTVRLGELREKGGHMAMRGIVVCIQTAKQEPMDGPTQELLAEQNDADEELRAGQALVRDIWASFGVSQAKETISPRPPRETNEQPFDEVHLWCEALRFQK